MMLKTTQAVAFLLTAVVASQPLAGQASQSGWESLLEQLPESDRGPVPFIGKSDCGAQVPDSVLVRGRFDGQGLIYAWTTESGWKQRPLPKTSEVVALKVIGAVCSRGDSVLTYLALRRDNAFLALLPSSIPSNDDYKPRVGSNIAFQRVGDSLSPIFTMSTDGRLNRIVSEPMLRDSLVTWRERALRTEQERQALQRVMASRARDAQSAEVAAKARKVAAQASKSAAQREASLTAFRQRGWTSEIIELVLARRIAIGMTTDMVRESLGRPSRINRTINERGVSEQWVYGADFYVYAVDGIVRTIQDSR